MPLAYKRKKEEAFCIAFGKLNKGVYTVFLRLGARRSPLKSESRKQTSMKHFNITQHCNRQIWNKIFNVALDYWRWYEHLQLQRLPRAMLPCLFLPSTALLPYLFPFSIVVWFCDTKLFFALHVWSQKYSSRCMSRCQILSVLQRLLPPCPALAPRLCQSVDI
jgi:hypothetical protein